MDYRLYDPGSSFYDFLSSRWPQRPHRFLSEEPISPPSTWKTVPHGTTVLALKYKDGVVIAGDRMATEGFTVSARRIEKVFKTDEYSAIAIAGAAGPCLELARLFQTELEHYEKLEGVSLSTDGKANKLAQMVRGNLPMAFQGLVVIPLFVGYDLQKQEGRIFKYDITGGRYEETEYHATGSGGRDARNTLKTYYKAGLDEAETLRITVEALLNAAEEDIGTGGPDPVRGIYPTVKKVTRRGIADVEESRVKQIYEALIEKKKKGA